ncbi:MAG: methylated-DNA--[protein]-cysteine S-methyltransferase [Leptolyngbyaceae cyanobacterium CSU_1_4]|nr:methylated-DNA--[protein]-cysteine S-methyltransferase [Leptolyngbyaceae cyanobacterium CSU_1_4]
MEIMGSLNRIENSEDYNRVARAIAFIQQSHLAQPSLATIAQHIGLSDSHFQRLFTQWAGISPKRFLQYLNIEYAKSKISQSKTLLDLTLDLGLSSSGRLHDLFVNLEAMSPGEFKTGGAGLTIHYGIHPTPFGTALLATTLRGICHLQFDGDEQALRSAWAKAELVFEPQATQPLCDLIFNPESAGKRLTVWVKGTNFQVQVWRALLTIPFGEMTTYQRLAEQMGRPTAARAVGNAVGKNSVGYLIPCHRVIRESGELGGYRWGVERKTAMLGWEASWMGDRSPS